MKEILLTKKNLIQGGSVKKTLFVVAVAAMLVLSVASSAFAVNHSGQFRLGAAQNVGAPVGGGGSNPANNVAGAGSFTYMDWSTGLGTNNLSTSPHGAYTTTTTKCVVCHAVHYAAPGGAPVGAAGATADTLLRMKASDSCAFCHVTSGQTVNGRPVYDGVVPVTSGGSANSGHAVGSNCNECHTGVHGVGADQSIPALNGFLLKTMTTTSPSADMASAIQAIETSAVAQGFAAGAATGFTPVQWTDPASTGAVYREAAVGIFCAECHNGAYATVAAGASTSLGAVNNAATAFGAGASPFSGHRVMASATATWNAGNSVSSSAKVTGAVAFLPANDCKSCHDANDTFGNKAFPHSWGGTKMWLKSAAYAGAATTNLPYGTAAGSGYSVASGGTAPQLSDGVCLKCHRSATAGVGLDY